MRPSVAFSTAKARSAGTRSHWLTAWGVTLIARAKAATPPTCSIARSKALSRMGTLCKLGLPVSIKHGLIKVIKLSLQPGKPPKVPPRRSAESREIGVRVKTQVFTLTPISYPDLLSALDLAEVGDLGHGGDDSRQQLEPGG